MVAVIAMIMIMIMKMTMLMTHEGINVEQFGGIRKENAIKVTNTTAVYRIT